MPSARLSTLPSSTSSDAQSKYCTAVSTCSGYGTRSSAACTPSTTASPTGAMATAGSSAPRHACLLSNTSAAASPSANASHSL
jgi:hypothetical protein